MYTKKQRDWSVRIEINKQFVITEKYNLPLGDRAPQFII